MSNISQKNFRYQMIAESKKNSKKNKKIPNSNSKPKPLPEWNNNINDLDKYKLSSSETVKKKISYSLFKLK
jgi:hypothetical protein